MVKYLQKQVTRVLTCAALSLAAHSAHATGNHAADALAIGLPALATGWSVYHGDTEGIWQLAKAEAVTLGVSSVLKSIVHETRPNGKDDKSFPSRHTSVAFAAARYLQVRGGWEYGLPAYIAATAVAYERVHQKEHYSKEVLAGALIGIASSSFFTDKPYHASVGYLPGEHTFIAHLDLKW